MEKEVAKLTQKIQKITNGFLDIQEEARQFALNHSIPECFIISKTLLSSEIYQPRSLGTFILGFIACESNGSLNFLKNTVSKDKDWRVQEILAKAFDRYCSDTGYKEALPVIKDWLKNKNPNVRRAVTEGLRIWTGREYFKDNPVIAIKMLSKLKNDESEYVRKSVGNALKDISKKHKNLVKDEIGNWDLEDEKIKYTYRFASKYL